MASYTVVERISDQVGYHCGYCGKEDSAIAKGMWAHLMNSIDYQDLIDRGWRRSGKYCYKPTMSQTCCPQYTIRCRATEFYPTKSKRKVLNRMKQFLMTEGDDEMKRWKEKNSYEKKEKGKSYSLVPSPDGNEASDFNEVEPDDNMAMHTGEANPGTRNEASKPTKEVTRGVGADPTRPRCRKAKILRMERRKLKQMEAGDQPTSSKAQNGAKSISQLIPHLNLTPEMKRKLEIRLVPARVDDPEFERTKKESHQVYQKYQQVIHKDSPSECTERQWIRFLVDCPLNRDPKGPGPGYGNFHLQYVLDGRIIAVGVVDILPRCISSVYLYYDPDYGFLSLGVYSALSEIAFVQKLSTQNPNLQFYYMGFYIHSCPKMRYKSEYPPSELLCPETYSWVPVKLCEESLDKAKYCRLNVLNGGSADACDPHRGESFNLNDIAVLFQRAPMDYGMYSRLRFGGNRKQGTLGQVSKEEKDEKEEMKEYLELVGTDCAKRMFLYRPGDRF